MSKTEGVTPQELFEAYQQTIREQQGQDNEPPEGVYLPPATYAEVDEQRKAIFEQTADHVNRLLANLNDQEILAEVAEIKQETDNLEMKLRETMGRIRRLDGRRSQLVRKLSKQEQINHLFD